MEEPTTKGAQGNKEERKEAKEEEFAEPQSGEQEEKTEEG
jgi:hypothetical protein